MRSVCQTVARVGVRTASDKVHLRSAAGGGRPYGFRISPPADQMTEAQRKIFGDEFAFQLCMKINALGMDV